MLGHWTTSFVGYGMVMERSELTDTIKRLCDEGQGPDLCEHNWQRHTHTKENMESFLRLWLGAEIQIHMYCPSSQECTLFVGVVHGSIVNRGQKGFFMDLFPLIHPSTDDVEVLEKLRVAIGGSHSVCMRHIQINEDICGGY